MDNFDDSDIKLTENIQDYYLQSMFNKLKELGAYWTAIEERSKHSPVSVNMLNFVKKDFTFLERLTEDFAASKCVHTIALFDKYAKTRVKPLLDTAYDHAMTNYC